MNTKRWGFDTAGRVHHALFLLAYGALLVVSFPWVMVWWLIRLHRRNRRVRHGH